MDVWEWCLYYDYELFSKRTYLKIIAYAFQWLIEKGDTPKHIIEYVKREANEKGYYYNGKQLSKIGVSLPPRAGKSYVTSVCSAWAIGKFPKESLMRNACTERLYQKFSYDVREVLKSEQFQDVFDVALSPDKAAISGWNTNHAKQVSYFGAGVGGTIIGFGASLIAITDDLYKSMIDALSPNTIEKVKLWKESAHDTRCEGNCPEMDIGTRWSKKDVLGQTEKAKKYDLIIRVPALIDNKSFCEDVRSTEKYLEIKSNIGPFLWSAGYMQQPAELEGSCFPREKLKRYKLADIKRFDYITVNYTDVADQGKDYLCSTFFGIIDKKAYLLDVIYTKKDSNYTVPKTVSKFKEWDVQKSIYESNNQGLMYTKLLKKEFIDNDLEGYGKCINAVPNSKNKHSRIVIQADWIINNMYFREDIDIEDLPEYQEYLEHLCDYMKDKPTEPDDAPDGTAGGAVLLRAIIK